MTNIATALSAIPPGLRTPLLSEYKKIIQNYYERRWEPAGMNGGKFCEIVYTILAGYADGQYAPSPSKPPNIVDACRQLEANGSLPRSFQILIPRILPVLYEIRNNRGIGHAGGEVDPNHMDAELVVSMANWVMAELVRVYQGVTTDEARALVDSLAERRVPSIWQDGNVKRVLDPSIALVDQLLLLISSSAEPVRVADLYAWTEYDNPKHIDTLLCALHQRRLVELDEAGGVVQLLPTGRQCVADLIAKRGRLIELAGPVS